jgi:predicted transcriptional regulator
MSTQAVVNVLSRRQQCRTPQPVPRLILTPGQVARTLNELMALGFVEKVKDEFGVTRYRPTNGRVV